MTPRIYDEANTHSGQELIAYRESCGIEVTPEERAVLETMRSWEGEGLPFVDDPDLHEHWRLWTTRSVYPWEHDGYPMWSHLYHLASWWPYRKLPNIRLVHYNDLLTDLDGQMRMLSEWLGIPVDEAVWPSLVESATFSTMKKDYAKTTPVITQSIWRKPEQFFHKGSTGQWRELFSDDELELYEVAANRELEPDAKRWMEEGSLGFADPKEI
jgi:aryl sulfotransferase